jgi:hypothetical protein
MGRQVCRNDGIGCAERRGREQSETGEDHRADKKRSGEIKGEQGVIGGAIRTTRAKSC